MVTTVLFIVAAVLCGLASLGVTSKIHLGWLGVAVLAVAFAL